MPKYISSCDPDSRIFLLHKRNSLFFPPFFPPPAPTRKREGRRSHHYLFFPTTRNYSFYGNTGCVCQYKRFCTNRSRDTFSIARTPTRHFLPFLCLTVLPKKTEPPGLLATFSLFSLPLFSQPKNGKKAPRGFSPSSFCLDIKMGKRRRRFTYLWEFINHGFCRKRTELGRY